MIGELYLTLLDIYGEQGWWPVTKEGEIEPRYHQRRRTERQRLEVVLGAILTQNTSWKNVEKAMINLNEEDVVDRERLVEISEDRLAQLIRPAGYFNQKAKKIKAFLSCIPEGKIPEREELLGVWGIGPETADSILLYAYDIPEFVVDAYTTRMFLIYGIIGEHDSYDNIKDKIEKSLKDTYSDDVIDVFKEYHALIVEHGKNFFSRKPYAKDDPVLWKLAISPKNL